MSSPSRDADSPTLAALDALLGVAHGRGAQSPARDLVTYFGSVRALLVAGRGDLRAAGIAPESARRLIAVRRLSAALMRARRGRRLLSSHHLARLVPHLAWHPVEELWVVPVDAGMRALGCVLVARGGAASCAASPAEILGPALRLRAQGIFVMHNHPSGDPTPSPADVEFTDRLRQAAKLMSVRLEDHLVIGGGRFASILTRKRGALGSPPALGRPRRRHRSSRSSDGGANERSATAR